MAPEIIPPMTRVVTYTKSSKPVKSRGGQMQSVTSSLNTETTTVVQSRGWSGGEFTPAASRSPATHMSASLSAASGNRSKRYSSQRQHNAAESGIPEGGNFNVGLSSTSMAYSKHVVSVTSMLPLHSRPIPATAFYGTMWLLCVLLVCFLINLFQNEVLKNLRIVVWHYKHQFIWC